MGRVCLPHVSVIDDLTGDGKLCGDIKFRLNFSALFSLPEAILFGFISALQFLAACAHCC